MSNQPLIEKLLNEYREVLINLAKDFPPIPETKYNVALVKRQRIKYNNLQKSINEIDQILQQFNEKSDNKK